jgi:hypothetical protein
MFSATIPTQIKRTISRYMSPDHILVDKVGEGANQTAET